MANRKRLLVKNQAESIPNDELEDLFVFGYHCKIFRDDERARYIDHGKHLIPWMGDPSLMIDRYDGRGHLFDIRPYDADKTEKTELTEEEKHIEQICNEERYLELHADIMEKALYEEEELKRLNEALNEDGDYGAVGFNYDEEGNTTETTEEQQQDADEEVDDPYEPPPELQVPPDMYMPSTVKHNAIIEKTAAFVSSQGMQMEIMLKMKQKDNPQFDFLDFSHYLNPFYKHVIKMIKANKYKPSPKRENGEVENHYLHPSLRKDTREAEEHDEQQYSAKFLSSVQSKLPAGQITNTLYAKLVSQMAKHTTERAAPVQYVPKVGSGSGTNTPPVMPPPPLPPYITGDDSSNIPPPPGMEPVTLPASNQPPPPGTVSPDPPQQAGPYPELTEPGMEHIIPPPPDMQPIINKMASYVAKNGPDFETIVRSKGEGRFDFLDDWHVHNPYYEYKKALFLKEIEEAEKLKASVTQVTQDSPGKTAVTKSTTTLERIPAMQSLQSNRAVSFSIKAKDNEGPSIGRRGGAFSYESSDEEGDGGERKVGDTESGSADGSTMAVDVDRSQHCENDVRPDRPQLSAEEIERRQAEEKLKDKLAVAAREKLAAASKEKQLQAERKRRAAMFINMLKGAPAPASGLENNGNDESLAVSAVEETVTSTLATVSGSNSTTSQTRSVADSVTEASQSTRSPRHRSRSPRPRSRSPRRSQARSHSPRRSRSPRRRSPYRDDRRDTWSRRSRSPIRKGSRHSRRKRSKTPPSAYAIIRRSLSRSPPKKPRSHSPILILKKKPKRSRSRSHSPSRKRDRPRNKSRSRSKSRQPTTKSRRSRSPSKPKDKSKKVSKSKSPTKSKKRSRSRSHSKSKKSSKNEKSPSKKSKKSKKKRSRSKSPKPSRSKSPKRSRSKSPKKKKVPTATLR